MLRERRRGLHHPGARAAIAGCILAIGLIAAACGGGPDFDDPRLQTFDNELTTPGQRHVPSDVTVNYPTAPPYGGPHVETPFLVRCGIYREQQTFEGVTHTMEHGTVIWYYHPDVVGPEEVETMRRLAGELLSDGRKLVLTPHREIQTPIALSAWGRLLGLQQYEADTIRAFVTAFQNQGPEPRAAC